MDSGRYLSQEKDGALAKQLSRMQLEMQDNEGKSRDTAIPLCLPDNWNWDPRTGKCVKTGDRRSSLYVIDEALEQLRKIKGPVCVVSIAGKLRMGKSFVLSEAFDQSDVFPLGHEMDPETMGIWLWIAPEKYKDDNGREFAVVLLDSEGIDSAFTEGFADHQIFTLTVLLASVLIFNSQNVPTRRDLEELDFIAKLSQRVQMQSNSGAVSAKKDDKFFHKTFPNFVWLLRDALLSIPQDCKDLKDYFLKKVLNKQESSATSSDGAEQVADSILRFFPEFDAFRLPPPALDLETMKNLKKNRDKVNPAFWTGLKDFKLLLRPILAPKRTFNDGEFVTGEGLAALVQLYTEAINTPGCIPNVQGAWDTFVNTKCSEAKQAAVLTYDALLTSQLSDVLPCDSDMIRVSHSAALDESEDQFMKEIAGFSTDTVELHAKELKASIEQKLTSWHSENEKMTRKLCEDLLGQLKSCHLDPVLRQLQGEAGAKLSFDDIIGAYGRIKGDYDNNASGAKHVIAAVFSEFHKELNKEKEQNLSWLSRLKDFEQQRMNDLAAKAYVEKEKKSLEEDKRRLLQENVEQKKQMELLIKNMEEDKKRFYEQMDDERKKQRVQTEDLIAAGRKEAQEEMQVFIAENNDLRNRNMEMQKASEDNMKMIKQLSDLIASKEKEKEEIRQQMKDEDAENTRAIIQEIDEKHREEIKALRDEMTAKVNDAIANYPSAPWTGRVTRPVEIDDEIETTDAGIRVVEKPGFLDLVKGLIPVLTFAAPYVAPIVGPFAARAAEALSKCSVM